MRIASSRLICFARGLQGKDQAHELLGGVRDGDIVVLALSSLLGKVSREGWIPNADVFCGIEKGVA